MNNPGLNEADLDDQTVTITLTEETYDNPLEAVNFTLGGTAGVDYPNGLSIESVIRNSPTEAVVNLAFNGTDFDSDFSGFYITIAAADLAQTSSGVLTPPERLDISSANESATLGAATALNEATLDVQTVTIDLNNETFNTGSLVAGNFTPNNGPAGLTIAGIVGTPTSTHVELDLQFIPGDFDVNYPNFTITIFPSVLSQSSAGLTTNSIPISSLNESATLDAATALNEAALDGQTVTIDLNNETFNTGSLVAGNFTPNNGPPGLTIVGIVGTPTSTHVELDLQFTPGDFG